MPKISKKSIYQARWDNKQMVLEPKMPTMETPRKLAVTTIIESNATIYYCPFCLFYGSITNFETTTAKGKPSKRMECPQCHTTMLRRTLTEKMNPEQYAEWCYGYAQDGFWNKVPFKTWSERLGKLGMTKRFWDKYKLLKGSSGKTESYEEHMNREAKEYAEKEGVML